MRVFRVNGRNVDIDSSTAIGITFQSYDVKEPGERKINASNTFTIPKTANNMDIFGHPGDPQSLSTIVYDSLPCDYWIDNLQVFKNTSAKVRVEEVGERISLYVYDKSDFWEELKTLSWSDFQVEFFNWLTIPKKDTPYIGTFPNFLYSYTTSNNGVYLPFFFSNLLTAERTEGASDYIETVNGLWLNYNGDQHGGHFCVYIKTIFEFIEQKYGVNFLTSGGITACNIWDDEYASKMYIPFRKLNVAFKYSGGSFTGCYFDLPKSCNFSPHEDVVEFDGKSVYDIITGFFQHFNILIDNIEINGQEVIRLARWDDIYKSEVIDWTGGLTGTYSFKPKIDGYAQSNIIKFESVYPDGADTVNQRVLTSLNKNLDASTELFEVAAYAPAVFLSNGKYILDLTVSESFEVCTFMIDSGNTQTINVYCGDGNIDKGATLTLNIPAIYSIENEYLFLDSIIKYPKFYTVSKWLKLSDIINIEFFKQYYIKELGGSFFINKISNFNPEKSTTATKIELIKISDKVPVYPTGLDYYVDGVVDYYTDGLGDYWY